MEKFLQEQLPEIFTDKYKSLLFVEPSKSQGLLFPFVKDDFIIDALEPGYREYHKAMMSGLYRLVINDSIENYEPNYEYDYDIIIYLDVEKGSFQKILDTIENTCKMLIMTADQKVFSKQDFLSKNFKVYLDDKILLAWRKT